MIEIPIFYGRLIVSIILSIPVWGMLWMGLARVFDYPGEPSWKTAIPAAAVVSFFVLCAIRVIVFV